MCVIMCMVFDVSVAVVVAFFICWAPFHAQRLLTIYNKEWTPLLHDIQSALFYISGNIYRYVFIYRCTKPNEVNFCCSKFETNLNTCFFSQHAKHQLHSLLSSERESSSTAALRNKQQPIWPLSRYYLFAGC